LNKHLHKLPLVLLFLVAVAFSLKSLREPDLWWQIRTGEWILENGKIPHHDVFSFTYAGTEWVNVKWGSEILFALLTKISGPESVFLLQALVSVLLVFTLYRLSRAFHISPARSSVGDFGFEVSTSIVVFLTLLVAEYRINGRPEMFSHLFTVMFLLFLLQYRKAPSNKIYWLIPLQVIWANLHEAFGIGIVLVGIFAAGEWIEYFLSKKGLLTVKKELPEKISLLLPLVIVSVIANPNGIALLTKPLHILGQVYENKFTTELFDFTMPDYWQWNVYVVIALLVITKAGWWWQFFTQKAKSRFHFIINELGVGYLLVLLAFFYLASTAYRNVIFFALVLFPALHVGLNFLLLKVPQLTNYTKQFAIAFCLFLFAFYISIVTDKYYEWTDSRDRFGLEVLSTYNPTGAADFVAKNKLNGKCFSDYLTSSYLLWRLKPEFKTFIDLRDLDVFPAEFFSTFAEAVTFPESFEKLDSVHRFNYVVLYRPQFASLHRFLFNESNFQLRFVDAVAAVYVRCETKDTMPVVFIPSSPVKSSALSNVVNKVFNPLYKPFNYTEMNYDYMAASYFSNIGNLNEAEKYALKAAANQVENYKGTEVLGEVYYNKALQATTTDEKTLWLNKAGNAYQQSINTNNGFAPAYLGIGAVYFQQQNYTMALSNFEKAIALDKANLNAHIYAAECCKYYINLNNAESKTYTHKAISLYKRADRLNPDNPNIMLNLGFLYFRISDCKNSSAYLAKVANFEGLSESERKQANDCLQKCGAK
jgi:tetratricopeptide (TPR) repeat protein